MYAPYTTHGQALSSRRRGPWRSIYKSFLHLAAAVDEDWEVEELLTSCQPHPSSLQQLLDVDVGVGPTG